MMKAKDTLFHINWGDGDTTFVIAPDEQTARERMGDGKDMVNYVVRLDALYQLIFKAGCDKRDSEFVYNPDFLDFQKGVKTGKELGIREVVEWVSQNFHLIVLPDNKFYDKWQAFKKERGL